MITYGEYVVYEKITTKEDVFCWIKEQTKIYSNLENYESKIEILCSYKDTMKRNYGKDPNKKLYKNIYAHEITVMMPTMISLNEKHKLVKDFMVAIDPLYKTKYFLYCYKFFTKGKGSYAKILAFTRKIYKRKQKRLLIWNSNYFWDPIKKRRCKESDENAVLLHKKGEAKLDIDGNKQFNVYFCSSCEREIFKYSSFSMLIKRLKKCIQYVKNCFFRVYNNKKYIAYITVDKKITVLSKRKLQLKNAAIKRMNEIISAYQTYFDQRYNLIYYDDYFFLDNKELKREFNHRIHVLDVIIHSSEWLDPISGNKVNLGVKQSFTVYRDNLSLVEDYLTQQFSNWWNSNIARFEGFERH